ncbi:hypothetical protein B0H11DRAFT_1918088 [Mycena galericulata]|nr:hypothetical protein B0H11DRAFT_1918088 [Mycena galericulata]
MSDWAAMINSVQLVVGRRVDRDGSMPEARVDDMSGSVCVRAPSQPPSGSSSSTERLRPAPATHARARPQGVLSAPAPSSSSKSSMSPPPPAPPAASSEHHVRERHARGAHGGARPSRASSAIDDDALHDIAERGEEDDAHLAHVRGVRRARISGVRALGGRDASWVRRPRGGGGSRWKSRVPGGEGGGETAQGMGCVALTGFSGYTSAAGATHAPSSILPLAQGKASKKTLNTTLDKPRRQGSPRAARFLDHVWDGTVVLAGAARIYIGWHPPAAEPLSGYDRGTRSVPLMSRRVLADARPNRTSLTRRQTASFADRRQFLRAVDASGLSTRRVRWAHHHDKVCWVLMARTSSAPHAMWPGQNSMRDTTPRRYLGSVDAEHCVVLPFLKVEYKRIHTIQALKVILREREPVSFLDMDIESVGGPRSQLLVFIPLSSNCCLEACSRFPQDFLTPQIMDFRTAQILVLFVISVLFAVLGYHPVNVRNISDILVISG